MHECEDYPMADLITELEWFYGPTICNWFADNNVSMNVVLAIYIVGMYLLKFYAQVARILCYFIALVLFCTGLAYFLPVKPEKTLDTDAQA